MVRWSLGILVLVIAAAVAAWWWLNRPMVVRHPQFGTDCSVLVSEANLNAKVDCIRVWYGTNRLLLTETPTDGDDVIDVASGLGESGDRLRLGRADVWLPKLIEQGGERELGETPHVQGSISEDSDKLAEYVFLTRITSNGRETFVTTLQDALIDQASDSVLLFIHGFNVQFDEALIRAAQLSTDLSRDDSFDIGIPVLYSWPSAGALSLDDYQGDRSRSLAAAPYLEQFLDILTEDIDATRINVIAHSMGNRVLTEALENYARDYLERHNREDLEFRIMFVAADVERDVFAAANGVFDNLDANVTIYTSDTDRALHISNIVNANDEKRLGDTNKNRPYIRNDRNYQTIDATAVATELFGIGHNYYSDNPTILWDMMCTFGEARPQDRALEIARFGDLPDGEQYYRINDAVTPEWDACNLRRTAFPAGGASVPPPAIERAAEAEEEDSAPIMPEAMPAPPGAGSSRSPASEPEPSQAPSRSMTPAAPQVEPYIVTEPEPVIVFEPSPIAIEFLVDSFDDINLAPNNNTLENAFDANREIASVQIRAASDTVGSAPANLARTQRYADAVADWFIARGVDSDLISAQGFGESDLAIETDDEIDEPRNRRVTIFVTYTN